MAHQNATHSQPNIFAVSLFAGITGAVVGLLFAPRSGKETRDKIQIAATDLKGKASEQASTLRNSAELGAQRAKRIQEKATGAFSRTASVAKEEADKVAYEAEVEAQAARDEEIQDALTITKKAKKN